MDLRCEAKKHAEIDEEGFIEIKCSSRFCGAGPGVVVIHRFATTGELENTLQFKDPGRTRNAAGNRTAVRAS